MIAKFLDAATAKVVAKDIDGLALEIGVPADRWLNKCHSVSLALLRTGRFGFGRIARGYAPGVRSQHSWIVLGKDVYDKDALIVDPTKTPGKIIVDIARRLGYIPRGAGRLAPDWKHEPHGEPVELDTVGMTPAARRFLAEIGPMGMVDWARLASGPMGGWPSREIIPAMLDRKDMRPFVPIDIAGHVTDRNPNGLYR